MKILVCVSKVPDTTTKITFDSEGKSLNTTGVQYILNPYDEWYALVRAVELVEKGGGSVTVINVGTADNDTIIRKALAIGATDGVRVDLNPDSSMNVAKQIAAYAADKGFDIVFTGKESIDFNASEVGAMIAEYLDQPYISYGTKLEMNGNEATIAREIEGGEETVKVSTPFVVSAAKGMAEQRIPNMMGIMKAKSKPFEVVTPVAFDDLSTAVHYELPPAKTGVKLVDPDNMEELVRLLHEEAKSI